MVQQGQGFKLKTKGADSKPLWAYRYRLQGRGSGRRQVGGFASRTEAQRALRKTLDRLRPGGRAATLTLIEFVEEYLQAHPGQPVTVSKLRWLLGKATAARAFAGWRRGRCARTMTALASVFHGLFAFTLLSLSLFLSGRRA